MTSSMSRRVTGAAIAVVGFVYLIYVWDRMVVGIELVEIRKEFGLSLADGGLLASVFTLGITLAAIPAGLVIMRAGTRLTLVLGAVLFSLATVWTALAPGLSGMIASRIAGGVGEALYNVALFTFLGRLTETRRGAAAGLPATLFGTGLFLGPLVISGLLAGLGTWRGPFLILAGAGLAGAAAIWLLLGRLAADTAPEERVPITWARVRRVLSGRNLLLCIVVAVNGIAMYSFIALYETFLRSDLNWSLATASLVVSVNGAGQLIGGLPMGYLADRIGRKAYLLLAALLAGAAGLALFRATSFAGCAGIAFAFGLAANSIYTNAIALIQDEVARSDIPLATGLLATVYFFTAAFSGYLLATVRNAWGWGPAGAIVYTIPFAVVAAIMLGLLLRPPAVRRPAMP